VLDAYQSNLVLKDLTIKNDLIWQSGSNLELKVHDPY